jgi:hypothetical protein
MNSTSNNDWQTVPERRQQYQYRGGRPQYGRPRPAFQPPLPPPETPLKKTEANFPKLVPNAPKKVSPEFATSFSKTVTEMAVTEEEQRLKDAYAKEQESKARAEFQGVYILGSVHRPRPRFVKDLVEEFDSADVSYEREEYDTNPPPSNSEDDGWTSVTQKVRKTKRELTAADLAAKYVAAGEAADREEEEFNGDLFHASHRHDHH